MSVPEERFELSALHMSLSGVSNPDRSTWGDGICKYPLDPVRLTDRLGVNHIDRVAARVTKSTHLLPLPLSVWPLSWGVGPCMDKTGTVPVASGEQGHHLCYSEEAHQGTRRLLVCCNLRD